MSKRLLSISKILADASEAVKNLALVPKGQQKKFQQKLSIVLAKLAKELSK